MTTTEDIRRQQERKQELIKNLIKDKEFAARRQVVLGEILVLHADEIALLQAKVKALEELLKREELSK